MKSQKLPPLLSKQASKFIERQEGRTQRLLQNSINKIPEGDILHMSPTGIISDYAKENIEFYGVGYRMNKLWLRQ